jgi:HK97 family phage portal protein
MLYAKMMSGGIPIFSQFGNDIYASDVVQQAISCIVYEMKKLKPMHVRTNEFDLVPVSGHTQKVLKKPNPLMTMGDFLEKVYWNYFLNYNSFILKVKEGGKLKALYPLQPVQVDFLENANGTLFVKFRFSNGYESTIPYSEVIHLRRNYSVNDFMGGNEHGQPDHSALLKTLDLNNTLLEGIAKAMKSSFAVNGVIKYNTLIDESKMEDNISKMEKRLLNNESGFMGLDLKGEFIPITRDIQMVDEPTLQFIDSKILRHYGVSIPILTGDYTKEQYEAFYQKALEHLIIQANQVFTDGIFSEGEANNGNEIQFFAKELIFMSTDQKLEMIRLLGDSGSMYENEKRKAFGMTPLPELAGVRMQSLNYVNSNIADKYQLKGDGGGN